MTTPAIDRIREALHKLGKTTRDNNGGFSAQCPAHDDRMPSLSVRGVEGKALLNCQAGCRTEDIAAALGLTMSDLFDAPTVQEKPVVVAEYPYVDETGELLYVKERRVPKDFRVKRPNGRGGWIWSNVFGGEGAPPRVLYRLPEVLAAAREGRTVYVVEGEKDADALTRLGHVATCNFDGAAKEGQRPKWRPEYGEALRGAQVVIVADRDEPGRAHARAIRADLQAKARSVTVVQAAVEAEHADVSDHLAAGHGLDALVPLDAAPSPSPAPEEEWDDPVPLGTRGALPPFPTHVFPGYIAAMVRGVAEEIQVPEDLPGSLALAVLGTAAGGRAEVLVRGQWREPLNVQLATAMPPGAGKSPTFRLMLRPVFAAETALQEAVKEKIKEIEKEQRDAVARAEAARKLAKTADDVAAAMDAAHMAQEMEIPIKPRLTADDVVPEQAATILADQGGRLAILSAEGTFFEVVMGRYSGGKPNLELVLKGHAGDRLQIDRRGREEFVERPALTIGICLQPQMLQDIAAKRQMSGRGALARLLLSVPPDNVGFRSTTPELLNEGVIRDYTDTIMGLIIGLNGWTDPAVIVMTPGALKLHTEWRAEIEPRLRRGTGDLEALREWASKLAGHTVRMAGLLHLAENPSRGAQTPISEDTMRRAVELARYYAEHAMAAFGVMRAHPLLDKAHAVLEWIGERREFKPRDVHRAMHRRFDGADEVAAVLRLLEDHGYIREAPTASTGGRKPVVYRVTPKPLRAGDTVTKAP